VGENALVTAGKRKAVDFAGKRKYDGISVYSETFVDARRNRRRPPLAGEHTRANDSVTKLSRKSAETNFPDRQTLLLRASVRLEIRSPRPVYDGRRRCRLLRKRVRGVYRFSGTPGRRGNIIITSWATRRVVNVGYVTSPLIDKWYTRARVWRFAAPTPASGARMDPGRRAPPRYVCGNGVIIFVTIFHQTGSESTRRRTPLLSGNTRYTFERG